MSRSNETRTLQAHLSERSMNWHNTVTKYRRIIEDALLKKDVSILQQNFPIVSFVEDWFFDMMQDSPLIAKFHLASLFSSCVNLAVEQGLPRALAHGIKDDFFDSLAREQRPSSIAKLTMNYIERLICELRILCRRKYSYLIISATTFIYQNLYQNIRPHDVAEYLKKDRTYLAKKFKEETGLTLTEYIRRAKISRSQYLISQHTYSLYEIAELLGYPNYAQFLRDYRKETSSTPGESA